MMNDLSTISPTSPDQSRSTQGEARRASLERARRAASADQVASAEQAQVKRAEQFRQSNEIVQRAIGANTRLEIAEGQGSNPFTYRAVDIESGEVVSEWPPAEFANLLNKLSASLTGSQTEITGVVVNERV